MADQHLFSLYALVGLSVFLAVWVIAAWASRCDYKQRFDSWKDNYHEVHRLYEAEKARANELVQDLAKAEELIHGIRRSIYEHDCAD